MIQKIAFKMALRGSGVRDISEVLNLDPSAVLDKLRRAMRRVAEPKWEGSFEEVQSDEFWPFVNQRKTL
jgi:transposase-like protein